MQQVFSFIKDDNVKEFSQLIEEKRGTLSLRLGRFPILSLCYLYKSKKIIARFFSELIAVKSYRIEQEPYEAYEKFKSLAKKSLRLYTSEDACVTPLEMLAILRDSAIIKLYPQIEKTQEVMDNIVKIYRLSHDLDVACDKEITGLDKLPLSEKNKLYLRVAAIIMASMVLFSGLVWGLAVGLIGYGNDKNYGKIYSGSGFYKALGSQNHIMLVNDINVNFSEPVSFDGTLDGNGKTIYINADSAPLIDDLTGVIKNVNIVWNNPNGRSLSSDSAIFALTNSGIIENVTFTISGKISLKSENEESELIVSALVLNNKGSIVSCQANVDLTLTGNGLNAIFSVFAGTNEGELKDCILGGEAINAVTVDVSGMVIYNQFNATIDGCTNNLNIIQTTESNYWNPNSSAIVAVNQGIIKNCINNGNVSAITLVDKDGGGAYAAGIVINNLGLVEKCKNNGTITATAQSAVIYCGGISAINQNALQYCIGVGDVIVSTDNNEIFAFGGGVSGFSNYAVENCISVAVVSTPNQLEWIYLGGIMGIAYFQSYYWGCYYTNMPFGLSAIMTFENGINVVYGHEDTSGLLATVDEIKQLDIYWE